MERRGTRETKAPGGGDPRRARASVKRVSGQETSWCAGAGALDDRTPPTPLRSVGRQTHTVSPTPRMAKQCDGEPGSYAQAVHMNTDHTLGAWSAFHFVSQRRSTLVENEEAENKGMSGGRPEDVNEQYGDTLMDF